MICATRSQDKDKGFSVQVAQIALARLDSDLDDGILELVFCDYALVFERARKISNTHTWTTGHRAIVQINGDWQTKRFLLQVSSLRREI